MEKIETRIDDQAVKELYRPLYRLIIVAFAVAIAFIAFYVVFSAVTKNWLDALNIVALCVSVILIFMAIILWIKLTKQVKQAQSFGRTAFYEFMDEYVSYEVYRQEEKIEEGKCYYRDLLGYKEAKQYVFLVMRNNAYMAVKKVNGLIAFIESKGLIKTKVVT